MRSVGCLQRRLLPLLLSAAACTATPDDQRGMLRTEQPALKVASLKEPLPTPAIARSALLVDSHPAVLPSIGRPVTDGDSDHDPFKEKKLDAMFKTALGIARKAAEASKKNVTLNDPMPTPPADPPKRIDEGLEWRRLTRARKEPPPLEQKGNRRLLPLPQAVNKSKPQWTGGNLYRPHYAGHPDMDPYYIDEDEKHQLDDPSQNYKGIERRGKNERGPDEAKKPSEDYVAKPVEDKKAKKSQFRFQGFVDEEEIS